MKAQSPDEKAEGTRKTEIIQSLFDARYNSQTKTLSSFGVTLEEVSVAITAHNLAHPELKPMSTRNPANFFKDFIRNQNRANKNWPTKVFKAGYSAVQVTSEGKCFEFVPISPGQTLPFQIDVVLRPSEKTPHYQIESISLPLASRRLGRTDEPWLIQVLVRLRVLETHLALCSERKILQLDHLQTNVKLSSAEIDALFLAIEDAGAEKQELLVCCEAKNKRDDIIVAQILGEVRSLFRTGISQELVLPIAAKAISPSRIFVVEFKAVGREEIGTKESLDVASTAVYDLVPPVPGIGL